MVIYTIGYTKKSLRDFIGRLRKNNIDKVIDIRLNNTSQLAGYSKKDDLAFILELFNISYEHRPILAPTEDLLKAYTKKQIDWPEYERVFRQLLEDRKAVLPVLNNNSDEHICFLCTEDKPEHCHRRLVAEHYLEKSGGSVIKHI
jgi:uncharacterized protein (DUF488 family)